MENDVVHILNANENPANILQRKCLTELCGMFAGFCGAFIFLQDFEYFYRTVFVNRFDVS
jgi:hypothetical protein